MPSRRSRGEGPVRRRGGNAGDAPIPIPPKPWRRRERVAAASSLTPTLSRRERGGSARCGRFRQTEEAGGSRVWNCSTRGAGSAMRPRLRADRAIAAHASARAIGPATSVPGPLVAGPAAVARGLRLPRAPLWVRFLSRVIGLFRSIAPKVRRRRMAEAHGNRTHQSRLSRDSNGFEVRGSHQTSCASERAESIARVPRRSTVRHGAAGCSSQYPLGEIATAA